MKRSTGRTRTQRESVTAANRTRLLQRFYSATPTWKVLLCDGRTHFASISAISTCAFTAGATKRAARAATTIQKSCGVMMIVVVEGDEGEGQKGRGRKWEWERVVVCVAVLILSSTRFSMSDKGMVNR